MADAAAASLPSSSSLSFCDGLRPAAAMVAVQSLLAGVNILYKLATSDGMSAAVLVAYRFLFGAAVLCPIAYFLERKKRPQMTWMVLAHAFFSGLFGGTLVQNLYVVGLQLTSVTFATATINLGPAMTFVLAVAFRLEKAGLGTTAGYLKIAGTAVAVGGAMLLTLYKGAELDLWSSSINLLDHYHTKGTTAAAGGSDRLVGSLLCVGSCMSYSLWLILQAKMGHYFPCPYSSTALMCTMGALQAVVYALVVERGDSEAWRLGFDVRLLTVVYNGVMASALTVTVLAWVINKKGPLYASVFNPLMLVISAVLGSLLLGEKLHLGSVLGSALIVLGLYLVLWGKRREAEAARVADQEKNLPTTSQDNTPRGGCSAVPSSRFSVVTDCLHLGPGNMLQFWGEEEIARTAAVADVGDDEQGQRVGDPMMVMETDTDTYKSGKCKHDTVCFQQ